MNENSIYHIPALLHETVDGLNIQPDGIYVDVTFGGGGHSREILHRLGKNGHLYSFDQDKDAMTNAIDDDRWTFVYSNFRYLKNFLLYYNEEKIDGVLGDLGVSFHHFDEQDRGFSFRFDGDLDMRMNQRATKTAATVLNTYSEEELADVFFLYGELRNARKIAKTICKKRENEPFLKINQLLNSIQPFFSKEKEKKDIARIFQALRIEVNDEMKALEEMLKQATEMLKIGGRISILTYHSLEDRIVKNFFKTGNIEGKVNKDFYGNVLSPLKPVFNKAIVASPEEVEQNPRSRSAKLRVAEKIGEMP